MTQRDLDAAALIRAEAQALCEAAARGDERDMLRTALTIADVLDDIVGCRDISRLSPRVVRVNGEYAQPDRDLEALWEIEFPPV